MRRVWLSALLCVGLACGKKDKGSDSDRSQLATPAHGLRVPLPEGWNLKPLSGTVFQAGPSTKPLLRLELFLQGSIPRPNLEAWKSSVLQALPGVSFLEEESSPKFLSLRFQSPEGKSGWLGAAIKEEFWVGCSMLGAPTQDEWHPMKRACAGVERVDVLRPTPKR